MESICSIFFMVNIWLQLQFFLIIVDWSTSLVKTNNWLKRNSLFLHSPPAAAAAVTQTEAVGSRQALQRGIMTLNNKHRKLILITFNRISVECFIISFMGSIYTRNPCISCSWEHLRSILAVLTLHFISDFFFFCVVYVLYTMYRQLS